MAENICYLSYKKIIILHKQFFFCISKFVRRTAKKKKFKFKFITQVTDVKLILDHVSSESCMRMCIVDFFFLLIFIEGNFFY